MMWMLGRNLEYDYFYEWRGKKVERVTMAGHDDDFMIMKNTKFNMGNKMGDRRNPSWRNMG